MTSELLVQTLKDNIAFRDKLIAIYHSEWQNQEGRIKELEAAINKCLDENRHLADGDVCTLIDLKNVMKRED